MLRVDRAERFAVELSRCARQVQPGIGMTDTDVVVLDDPVHKEAEVVAHFHAPAIQHNPDGWGPCELPDQFKDIPYQPFSKGDRLGKVSVARGSLAPLYLRPAKPRSPLALLSFSRRSLTGLRRPSRIRSSQVRISLCRTFTCT